MIKENPLTRHDPEMQPTVENVQPTAAESDGLTDGSLENPSQKQTASDTEPQTSDQHPAGNPTEELRQLLAEAEERGYRRGLNQQLREALNSPGLFEDLARRKQQQSTPQPESDDPLTSRFLTSIRPGIWD